MALTRKLEFVNKPSDTIMEIHGRGKTIYFLYLNSKKCTFYQLKC